MPCCVVVLAFFSPRLALVALALLTDTLSRSFDGWLLPLVGFFILPWTTLVYAAMWVLGTNTVEGFEWFVVAFAFLIDIGAYGGTARSRRGR